MDIVGRDYEGMRSLLLSRHKGSYYQHEDIGLRQGKSNLSRVSSPAWPGPLRPSNTSSEQPGKEIYEHAILLFVMQHIIIMVPPVPKLFHPRKPHREKPRLLGLLMPHPMISS